MFNKVQKYQEPDGSTAPVDSADYAQWLAGLPPFLREIMLTDLRERARQASAPKVPQS